MYLQNKNSQVLFFFLLFISSSGFFEKVQRTFDLPLPYVGDIVSSIFPISIILFLIIYFETKEFLKFGYLEIFFFIGILLILFVYYLNSPRLNYEHFSFISSYVWILNSYIIFKYLNLYKKLDLNLNRIIYFSILFLFFYNLLMNLIYSHSFNEYVILENKSEIYQSFFKILKRGEITALHNEGYILSFFYYYFLLSKFYEKQNIIFFFIFSLINFFSIYFIESRGLILFNIFSIIYIFIIIQNNKSLFYKKIFILLLFLLFTFNFGISKIDLMIKSTIIGLDKNFKNEEIKKLKNFEFSDDQKMQCSKNYLLYYCSEEEVYESQFSKEISHAVSSNTRLNTLVMVSKEYLKNPIFGISIDEIKKIKVNEDRIHSNLIIFIASTGFIGIILLVTSVYLMLTYVQKKKIGIYIMCFFITYSLFFDNLLPFMGLIFLLPSLNNKQLKNE